MLNVLKMTGDVADNYYNDSKKKNRIIIIKSIGALGTFSKNLKTSLKKIGLDCTLLLQKASLLGTARILRRTLDT